MKATGLAKLKGKRIEVQQRQTGTPDRSARTRIRLSTSAGSASATANWVSCRSPANCTAISSSRSETLPPRAAWGSTRSQRS